MHSQRLFLYQNLVQEELERADAQHGNPADIYEMLAILGEEYGELQKAILDFDYSLAPYDAALKECIQVGAMVLKTYNYLQQRAQERRGDKHE